MEERCGCRRGKTAGSNTPEDVFVESVIMAALKLRVWIALFEKLETIEEKLGALRELVSRPKIGRDYCFLVARHLTECRLAMIELSEQEQDRLSKVCNQIEKRLQWHRDENKVRNAKHSEARKRRHALAKGLMFTPTKTEQPLSPLDELLKGYMGGPDAK